VIVEAIASIPMSEFYTLATFLQGVVFFTLGLLVFFINYLGERIRFSRSMQWLGAFALGEALICWNQALAPRMTVTLLPVYLHLLAMLFAYGFLLVYGIHNTCNKLPDDDQTPLWRYPGWIAAALVLLVGAGSVIWVLATPQGRLAASQVEVLLRLTLATPGSILAGLGMRRQSYALLEPDQRQAIRPYLRLAEGAILAFGLLNLFPLPHQAWTLDAAELVRLTLAAVLRTLCGLAFTLGLTRALFGLWNRIQEWVESMEREQALQADRERISRDLHDGIIQSIYAAGLMLETVSQTIGEDPNKAQAQLKRVMDSLNETIQDVRRYIFDLRGGAQSEVSLEQGIQRLLRDFHINTFLDTHLEVQNKPQRTLSLERRRHLFQIVREALSNTARHARAQRADVQLIYQEDYLELIITDDGVGMESLQVSKGHGLRNIRERVRLLDGALRIESAPDEGVRLHITVPY